MNRTALLTELSTARDATWYLTGYLESHSDAVNAEVANLLAALDRALAAVDAEDPIDDDVLTL